MDSETLNEMSQSSNPNMSADEVDETFLKQIQKKGISISLVNPLANFSLPATTTPETRPKQIALAIDKTPKVPARSVAATENKPQATPTRAVGTPETRVSSARVTPVSTFHDIKPPGTQNRVIQSIVSEAAKVFSPNWSGSNMPTDNSNKVQQGNTPNRGMLSTPVNKTPANKGTPVTQSRLGQLVMGDNKVPRVAQTNQTMLAENKRVSQGQRVVPVQMVEGKMQSNQERPNVIPVSPPEVKGFTNQVRTVQPFVPTHEAKASPTPRMIAPKPSDMKINQINTNKQICEVKGTQVRTMPNMRLLTDTPKTRPSYIAVAAKIDGKSTISSSMIGENKPVNSFRMMAATIADSNAATRTQLGKVTAAQMRLHQAQTLADIPLPLHAKMVQTNTVLSDSKVLLPGTKVAVSSSDMVLKPGTTFEISPEKVLGTPVTVRGAAGKRGASTGSPAKKKCVKRMNPNAKNASMLEQDALNSSEDGNENGEKFFSTLKSNRGLTITPICPVTSGNTTSTPNSSGAPRLAAENLDQEVYRIVCPSCNSATSSTKFCHVCKCNLNTSIQNTQHSTEVVQNMPGGQVVVTKKMTNVIKQYIIQPHDGQSRSIQFGQTVQKKVLIKTTPVIQTNPKLRGVRRRKYVEPVCLTLSSDDEEEHMQATFNSIDDNLSQSQVFPQESEGSKSGQSSPRYQEEENNESDDQFPGVTDINPNIMNPQGDERLQYEEEEEEEGEFQEPDEEMDVDEENESIGEEEEPEEEEEEEEEEIPPEDEEEEGEMMNKSYIESLGMDDALRCRSVRIGSLKVHPKSNNTSLLVILSADALTFNAPMVTDQNKIVNITLKPSDITRMQVHFGRCLPIVFIYTTPNFAEGLRKSLNMAPGDFAYFDPTSADEKQKKITFLIDNITEDQKRFLRSLFLPDKKVQELDQKAANEILVRSTPSQQFPSDVQPTPYSVAQNSMAQLQKCDIATMQVSSDNQLTVTPVQPSVSVKLVTVPVPVTKLFTYPPPPQTGGIAITNEDLACLDEGEFLNDAIIDFYLK